MHVFHTVFVRTLSYTMLQMRYLFNKQITFSVRVYCNRLQMTSQRIKNKKYDTKSNGVTGGMKKEKQLGPVYMIPVYRDVPVARDVFHPGFI